MTISRSPPPGGARPIPTDGAVDSTLAILRDGYLFVSNRCDRLGSDIFATRITFRRAICMRGAAAAEIFYGSDRFTRVGAMPIAVLKLLQDFGSVQMLDGEAHHHRKALFLSLVTPASVARLTQLAEAEWRRRLPEWERAPEVVLFDEIRAILTRAACTWAGVTLEGAEAERRTRELSAMIESAGSAGPRNWRAQVMRSRAERWARNLVRQARAGKLAGAGATPLAAIAAHRDPDGEPLGTKVAAVELLNLLRPTVAVARFVVFAALALHRLPAAAGRISSGDEPYLDAFAQEVRRHSPFFPLIGGRAREGFEWQGHCFEKGQWVLLDLYGTNQDPACWPAPDCFRPERFLDRSPTLFDFVPQGGGEHLRSHRCPGEGVAVELIKLAARLLATQIAYDVPAQDLSVDLSHIPALPKSGFVLRHVSTANR